MDISRGFTVDDAFCVDLPSTLSVKRTITLSDHRTQKRRSRTDDAPLKIPQNEIQIGRDIGKGYFGSVSQGHWTSHEDVAIKKLSTLPSDMSRFLNSVNQFQRLHHEGILYLHGLCILPDPKSVWIIMEYIPGGDLKYWLLSGRGKVAGTIELINILLQVADTMCYLRKQECLPRDLRCRSILITEENNVKLSEFGIFNTLPVDWRQYNHIPKEYLHEEITHGKQLPNPTPNDPSCRSLHMLMIECCHLDPDVRPTVQQVSSKLEHFHAFLTQS